MKNRGSDFFKKHRKVAGLLVLAIGVAGLVLLAKNKKGPKRVDAKERVTAARVLTVNKVSVLPRALGYGFIQPGQSFKAVAQVGGKVVEINSTLKKGAVIEKGALLIRIDPAEPMLAKEKSDADVQQVLAKIRELDVSEKNTQISLKVEKSKLVLSKTELERKRKLLKEGVLSASTVDMEEQLFLSAQNVVNKLESTLNRIPSERQMLFASLSAARTQQSDAQLRESKTLIIAPFDGRVASVNVEAGQVINPGQVAVVLDGMKTSEAVAQIPLYRLKNVVPQGARPVANGKLDMERIAQLISLDATVRLKLTDRVVEWKGHVSRFSDEIDRATRTMGVYVVVEDPYLRTEGGVRPPLLKNMYAEVELSGAPIEDAIVVPRSAIHEGRVYVLDKNNRLQFRQVEIGFSQSDFSVIKTGVKEGEKLVLSDLVPAIAGMLIAPVEDNKRMATLIADATGLEVHNEEQ